MARADNVSMINTVLLGILGLVAVSNLIIVSMVLGRVDQGVSPTCNCSTGPTPTNEPMTNCASRSDVQRVELLVANNVLQSMGQVQRDVVSLGNRPALCYQARNVYTEYSELALGLFGTDVVMVPNWTPAIECTRANVHERTASQIITRYTYNDQRVEHYVAKSSIWTVTHGANDGRTRSITVTSQVDLETYAGNYLDLGALTTRTIISITDIIGTFVGFGSGYGCVFSSFLNQTTSVSCFVANATGTHHWSFIKLPSECQIAQGSQSWDNASDFRVACKISNSSCDLSLDNTLVEIRGECYRLYVWIWTGNSANPSGQIGKNIIRKHWADSEEKSIMYYTNGSCNVRAARQQLGNTPTWWGMLGEEASMECGMTIGGQVCDVRQPHDNRQIRPYYPPGIMGMTMLRIRGVVIGLENRCTDSGDASVSAAGNDDQCVAE